MRPMDPSGDIVMNDGAVLPDCADDARRLFE